MKAYQHTNRVSRGRTGEQVAAAFLGGKGYQVVALNQRTPLGEIDVVCRDSTVVVIVEVKARQSHDFGAALEAIGPRKVRRLRAAALWWLAEQGWLPCAIRFDAVIVSLDERGLPVHLEHLVDVVDGAL